MKGNALVLSTYVQGKWYVMAVNKLIKSFLCFCNIKLLFFRKVLYTKMIYGHLSWHV